jgi:catechol 2,3-dioxygenase-like lactoylglutathione lyase family enzyme
MYDHIGLRVQNVEKSARFYEAALKSLGHVVNSRDASGAGIGPKGASALWLHLSKENGTGAHVAFSAPDRAAVDRFHAEGLKAGGKDNGKPGLRADYSPTYYAAFLIDPDGNNVEAVCLK